MNEQVSTTEGLTKLCEAYNEALRKVFASRGISSSLDAIREAKQVPVLEAECDDDDGEIKLPEKLRAVFEEVFTDTPITISEIMMYDTGVLIDAEAQYTSHQESGGITVRGNLIVNPQIVFDLEKDEYYVGRRPYDKSVMEELWDDYPITPELVAELVQLVGTVDNRENSTLSIRREYESRSN